MKVRSLIALVLLFSPVTFLARGQKGRVTSLAVNPGAITPIHLRPDFESVIHLPEEVTSVAVGNPGSFHVEHNEAEPDFVYVKPIVRDATESNLLIAMKSGQHVVLDLISDGNPNSESQTVDFLIEYKPRRSFLVFANATSLDGLNPSSEPSARVEDRATTVSPIDRELALQRSVNTPTWTKWDGKQIWTSIGDIRQLGNQTLVSFSLLNGSSRPVEIVPPQIQLDAQKPKKSKGKNYLSDQIQVRSYRLVTTRLEAGERTDGVLVFDRPNFKSSTQSLFLQLAQADQVDHPILVKLPFTPPLVTQSHGKDEYQ